MRCGPEVGSGLNNRFLFNAEKLFSTVVWITITLFYISWNCAHSLVPDERTRAVNLNLTQSLLSNSHHTFTSRTLPVCNSLSFGRTHTCQRVVFTHTIICAWRSIFPSNWTWPSLVPRSCFRLCCWSWRFLFPCLVALSLWVWLRHLFCAAY